MKKNKKKQLVIAACLALLAVLAGTFAWINSQDQRINRVKTAAIKDGSVSVEETWKPKPIVPGTDTVKEVAVTNSGSTPVFVRVSYEEVLKYLTNKGAVSNRATGWKVSEKPSLSDDVPVEFDGQKYIDASSGYTDVTSKVKSGTAALPTGVKVYAKGSVTKDPVTGEENTTFNYVAFYEYAAGKYQAMDSLISVSGGAVVGTAVSDWSFSMTKAEYSVYSDGYSNKVSNWAASSIEGASTEGKAVKASLLGSAGKKYDTDYDYTLATLGLSALPQATPSTDASQIPLANGDRKGVQTDKAALGVSGINIEYGTDMTTIEALVNNKWVYNAEDGYFYFTSPINSGVTTPNLLKKLVFTNAVGTEYTNATYDLIVKMEAIQATNEALTDSTGWNLSGADNSATKKIIAYLQGQSAS